MASTDIDVKYVAHLARLKLSDEEEAKFGSQLGQILVYIAKLNELVKGGSNDMKASYEGVLDGLRRMLTATTVTATPPSDDMTSADRSQYHANLKNFADTFATSNGALKSLVGKVTITLSSANLVTTAKTDRKSVV